MITGDENSADQMAKFCNQFDMVCTQLNCAVIYCHHHSKGQQGQKRSMDRASGSGVFARDPDAMLDMIELDITDALRKAEGDRAVCSAYEEALGEYSDTWSEDVSQDDLCSASEMQKIAHRLLTPPQEAAIQARVAAVRAKAESRTAWRIEGTLREFAPFKPKHVWFDYPVHKADTLGVLGDLAVDGEGSPWQKGGKKKSAVQQRIDRQKKRLEIIENAYEALSMNGAITIKDLVEYTSLSKITVRNYIDEHPDFNRDGGYSHKECGGVKMKITSVFTFPLTGVRRGKKDKINTFYPSYPSLNISLRGNKCKYYPCKAVLEGSKNRGNIAPLKRGLYYLTPFLNPTPCAREEKEREATICNFSAR